MMSIHVLSATFCATYPRQCSQDTLCPWISISIVTPWDASLLNVELLECCNYTLQYEAIYNRWRQLTGDSQQQQHGNLTAANIATLGRILCGAPPSDISGISLDDYEYENRVLLSLQFTRWSVYKLFCLLLMETVHSPVVPSVSLIVHRAPSHSRKLLLLVYEFLQYW